MTSERTDGGPAFPQHVAPAYRQEPEIWGMSLLDWHAGKALPAIIIATSAGQHTPARRPGDVHIRDAIARDASADEDWSAADREAFGTSMEACDDADAQFWSVYGHYRPTDTHVGCECITDGPPGDKERAWAIAEHLGRLWGLPVKER